MFKLVIEKELGLDPFHRNQFGFHNRKCSIDAISQVCNFADTCRKKGLVCITMCIEVKNAFNTLPWEVILKETRRSSLSYILTRVLEKYLKDRVVVFEKIFTGVPQGSVVGPLLWNLVYDGLLAKFNNYVNLSVIAFADDLAIVTSTIPKSRPFHTT